MSEVFTGEARYLGHVEKLIGLPFFSDSTLEAAAHADIGRLPQDTVVARAGLYVAGLRLVLEAQSSYRVRRGPKLGLAAQELSRFREVSRDKVGEIRGELMTLDPGLETDAVAALRLALRQFQNNTRQRKPSRSKQAAEPLPPELIPVSAAARIVPMRRSNIQNRIWPPGVAKPRKIRLPDSPPEACCTWDELRYLSESKDITGNVRGLRPDVEIDWDRLPKSGQQLSQEAVDYAHQVQRQFVPAAKLRSPGDARLDQQLQPARPYHISIDALHKLFMGGYGFVEDYCNSHRIIFQPRLRPDKFRAAEYIRIEDAAEIWEAYEMIPIANADDVIVAEIMRQAGTARSQGVHDHLLPFEAFYVEHKRALRPKGRILEHIPDWLAKRLVGRLRPIPLPTHLLPMQSIQGIKDMGSSNIRRLRRDLGLRTTDLTLVGSSRNLPQVCFDWQAVKRIVGSRDLNIEIDFDALPRGPHDPNPERNAYARIIQAQLVPEPIRQGFEGVYEPVPAIPEDAVLLPIVAGHGAPSSVKVRSVDSPPMWANKSATDKVAVSFTGPDIRYAGMSAKVGLPEEKPTQVQHRDETPGTWRPAQHNPGGFISRTESLTTNGIAEALGVDREAVDRAIERIDFGPEIIDDLEHYQFHGQALLAIREQLVGVPLDYIRLLFKLADHELTRVRDFLKNNKYESFDGHVSPGAFAFLSEHIARARRLHNGNT